MSNKHVKDIFEKDNLKYGDIEYHVILNQINEIANFIENDKAYSWSDWVGMPTEIKYEHLKDFFDLKSISVELVEFATDLVELNKEFDGQYLNIIELLRETVSENFILNMNATERPILEFSITDNGSNQLDGHYKAIGSYSYLSLEDFETNSKIFPLDILLDVEFLVDIKVNDNSSSSTSIIESIVDMKPNIEGKIVLKHIDVNINDKPYFLTQMDMRHLTSLNLLAMKMFDWNVLNVINDTNFFEIINNESICVIEVDEKLQNKFNNFVENKNVSKLKFN